MSEEGFSAVARLVMGLVALIFGFYTIIVAPLLYHINFQAVMSIVVPNSNTPGTQYFLTPFVVPMFFYFYRGFSTVGGIILVLVAYYLWKGELWAYPVAILATALPTMFNVLPMIPYIAHVMPVQGGMPPATTTVVFGMAVFIILLVCKKSDLLEKLAKAIVFITAGMLGGITAVFCMQGTKALSTASVMANAAQNPGPLVMPEMSILGFSWPLQMFTVGASLAGIYMMAKRSRKGWWLLMFAGVAGIVANYPTQIVRMVTTDFLMAGLLGTVLVIALVIPPFKKRLIEEER
jgi:hypothetical protein